MFNYTYKNITGSRVREICTHGFVEGRAQQCVPSTLAIGGAGNPGATLVGAGLGALVGGIAGHQLNKDEGKPKPQPQQQVAYHQQPSSMAQQVEDERHRLEYDRLQLEREKIRKEKDALNNK